MASPPKLSIKKALHNTPEPHVFETFDPEEDYKSFQRHIILPIIHSLHDQWYIYYTDEPTLPLPVAFAPSQHSIELVYKLILDTDINSTNWAPFPQYIDYPPLQSASILIPHQFVVHGFFSPNIVECFISEDKQLYSEGDTVALGLDGSQVVVVKGIKEVGKYFILYEVHEVGMIPNGCAHITQLVIPLSSHPSSFHHLLGILMMVIFPCLYRSSSVFRKPGRVSRKDKVQNRFSNSS